MSGTPPSPHPASQPRTVYRRTAAALLAQENIRKVEVLEYPELGMEAIWKIEVEDFPAFILVDDKGNDFFQQIACSG